MAIRRTVVVAQGKGGVGKTSLTSNCAGLVAASGLRVLVIGLDPQGNIARDLGIEPEDGSAMFNAILSGQPMPVHTDVRPGLDVAPGGPHLEDLAGVMFSRSARGGGQIADTLQKSIEAIADQYDLILIDTPPGERVLVEAAMSVASAVLIPTRSDDASIDGIARVAERFTAARVHNPDLQLAGVLLFAIGSRSRRLETRVRRTMEGVVGESPIFTARVRHLESAAVDARHKGLLVHELEDAAVADRRARLAALRSGTVPEDDLLVRNAEGLAGDYEAVTRELLTRLNAMEEAA
jgi:cellulose biosynthesis protein BcsQ